MGFFGTTIESELDAAESRVKSKKNRENAVKRARLQVLERYGIKQGRQAQRQYADPAAMM